MSVAFYADEHFPGPITRALRSREVDILTVQEDDRVGADDAKLLQRATELGRVLVSMDDDFFVIVSREQTAGGTFSGVMSIPSSLGYRTIIDDLEMVAKCTDASEWQGLISRLPI